MEERRVGEVVIVEEGTDVCEKGERDGRWSA